MKCLVTGSAGFIGNALVKRLVEDGHEVKALIHKTQPKYCEKKVEYVNGDITDVDSIKPLVKNVDVVFHCAAFVKDYGSKDIFYRINVDGTKNLVEACEEFGIKKFIFIGHTRNESEQNIGHYSRTKALTEQYLLEKYKHNNFPAVILCPGNVYGPGATTWVLRPLERIKKNRIALIDNGKGIFLHTYIDNLIDAIMSAMNEPKTIGKTIDITDGDNTITWGKYLNDLAEMAGEKPIRRNMSKNTALAIGKIMMLFHRIFRIKPWITPTVIYIFTNSKKVSILNAEDLLDYKPAIDYNEGIMRVRKWLQDENYI